jgi:hypothetical protein
MILKIASILSNTIFDVFRFALLRLSIKLINAKMGKMRTTLKRMPDTIQKLGSLDKDCASVF